MYTAIVLVKEFNYFDGTINKWTRFLIRLSARNLDQRPPIWLGFIWSFRKYSYHVVKFVSPFQLICIKSIWFGLFLVWENEKWYHKKALFAFDMISG